MLRVTNVKVYDLEESVIASRNAFRIAPPEYTDEEFKASLDRAKKLANTPTGSGHQNFLKGIRVSFDLVYPNYISPELQRYNWIDIVTSSSKMHTIMKMDFDLCCNKYVLPQVIDLMKKLVRQYNETPDSRPILKYERLMEVISNCPQGIELFMRVSTNYLQLKTIWHQRVHHLLKEDWGAMCGFIESLPYSKEFGLCG